MTNLAKIVNAYTWYCYCLPSPIDFGWEFLPTIEEIRAAIAATPRDCHYISVSQFEILLHTAQEAVRHQGYWEGDFRNGPVVMCLPKDEHFEFAFVWKQDNNGTTFVASPIELPWLDEDCV